MTARIVHTGLGRREAIDAMQAEGLDVLEWTDAAGATYARHTHPHREVRFVLDGELTITCDAGEFTLRAGDRLELAPGEHHGARVGPSGVRYLAGTDEAG